MGFGLTVLKRYKMEVFIIFDRDNFFIKIIFE